MPYTVNYTNPLKTPITVNDAIANTDTSLKLLGKNYDQYGELIAENFLHVLENFSNGSAPSNPTNGQLWYDTTTKLLKIYDVNASWKNVIGSYVATTDPVISLSHASGDLWINKSNGEIFVFDGIEWISLLDQSLTSGVLQRERLDTENISHNTLEIVNGTVTLAVISTDATAWVPKSTELLPDSGGIVEMDDKFPSIKPGINFTNTFGVGIHRLSSSTINVGRGNVLLENNSNDNTDGAGVTLRTEVNPTDGSIFAVRSAGNGARLWVGQSITTAGNNSFLVGDPTIGQEFDVAQYAITLSVNGNISASTVSGNWIATNPEAVTGTNTTKIMNPLRTHDAINSKLNTILTSDTFRATQLEAEAGTSNFKLMTPLRTTQHFSNRIGMATYQYRVPTGTAPGTHAAGINYRPLNTIISSSFAAGNGTLFHDVGTKESYITLLAGKYMFSYEGTTFSDSMLSQVFFEVKVGSGSPTIIHYSQTRGGWSYTVRQQPHTAICTYQNTNTFTLKVGMRTNLANLNTLATGWPTNVAPYEYFDTLNVVRMG